MPTPCTGREFAKQVGIGLGWKKPLLLPTPAFALRVGVGEMADVLLGSSRIIPARAIAQGFQYQFEDLAAAVADLIDRGL